MKCVSVHLGYIDVSESFLKFADYLISKKQVIY